MYKKLYMLSHLAVGSLVKGGMCDAICGLITPYECHHISYWVCDICHGRNKVTSQMFFSQKKYLVYTSKSQRVFTAAACLACTMIIYDYSWLVT